ncbi:AAA family ATPase [Pseudomonas aeruginosa]|nr:AAA family ATPase [Pseudomonas aeruginosa]EIY2739629.1 AAA family ATPase [Pseudomonas aeruginosa]EJC9821278.1 AAA family ATPase [Pseudomonas aeruginosa]EJN1407650.1 AAA family ATPase [Pseudomonas aeruginosa]EJV1462619.1 AAA family ATPase [Pseudomonas aeruginosa]
MRSREIKGPLDLIVGEFKNLKKLSEFGISPTSKVLFTGPPGVGKTVAARYLASKLKLPLVVLDLASVVSSFLGRTGVNIKKALEYASSRPCVLLLDEIDSIAKKRDDISDVGEIKRLVTVVLQELDLWQSKGILIAATNHYHLLDPAVQRRFDRVVEFKRPGFLELLEVGGLLIRREEKVPKAWIVFMAKIMADTSFSDFQREVNNLRRHYLIEGEVGAEEYLRSQLEIMVRPEDRAFRKELAVLLVKDGRASQRSASRVTGVSRDTLRHALTAEV